MSTEIHPTAIVPGGAEIDEDAWIGPYCVLSESTRIGKSTKLISHVAIDGDVTLGGGCTVYPNVTIGFPPQDIKYKGEPTSVTVGENNIIREYVSIHRGSVGGDGSTTLGDDNFIMAYVHFAHDCKLGSNIIIANTAAFGGHVEIGDHAFISGLTAVHQFVRIGSYAMVAALSRINQDVTPYTMVKGSERARLYGLNTVGLKRAGFSDETISELKSAYRIIFREKLSLKEAIKKVQEELPYTDEIKYMLEFIQENKRGFVR